MYTLHTGLRQTLEFQDRSRTPYIQDSTKPGSSRAGVVHLTYRTPPNLGVPGQESYTLHSRLHQTWELQARSCTPYIQGSTKAGSFKTGVVHLTYRTPPNLRVSRQESYTLHSGLHQTWEFQGGSRTPYIQDYTKPGSFRVGVVHLTYRAPPNLGAPGQELYTLHTGLHQTWDFQDRSRTHYIQDSTKPGSSRAEVVHLTYRTPPNLGVPGQESYTLHTGLHQTLEFQDRSRTPYIQDSTKPGSSRSGVVHLTYRTPSNLEIPGQESYTLHTGLHQTWEFQDRSRTPYIQDSTKPGSSRAGVIHLTYRTLLNLGVPRQESYTLHTGLHQAWDLQVGSRTPYIQDSTKPGTSTSTLYIQEQTSGLIISFTKLNKCNVS